MTSRSSRVGAKRSMLTTTKFGRHFSRTRSLLRMARASLHGGQNSDIPK